MVVVAILLVGIFLYDSERQALAEAEAAVVEARADSTRLHDVVQRVRIIENSQALLALRVEVLRQIVDGRLFWIDLLETLSRELPEYTWLEAISGDDLDPRRIQIAGATFSNAAVTDYMRGLEASPHLENVTLVAVSRVERDEVLVQGFTLYADLEGFDPDVIEPEDEGEPDDEEQE
jgi:Tfp pilus assembly protein PilN